MGEIVYFNERSRVEAAVKEFSDSLAEDILQLQEVEPEFLEEAERKTYELIKNLDLPVF